MDITKPLFYELGLGDLGGFDNYRKISNLIEEVGKNPGNKKALDELANVGIAPNKKLGAYLKKATADLEKGYKKAI